MATVKIQVRNGQVIAAPSGEKEVQLDLSSGGTPSKVGFLVTSGAMQVTTGATGGQDVIGGTITAFANTVNPVYMRVAPDSLNLFIKGSGTITIFW
jgi:hypothetical protein